MKRLVDERKTLLRGFNHVECWDEYLSSGTQEIEISDPMALKNNKITQNFITIFRIRAALLSNTFLINVLFHY